ncbi:CWF complex protein sap62 [Tilletia horrida]|uniref:CWF complex protein sap62 n=1 Tax=Tilletia horrida TaxID=155126 RepID=A0AAN6GUD1_9BASI|nr:CWF complex protein sap62 [Tilletia horrida]KAK0557106.1 CWF complex protein sap62 [Tilletia horrida]KAK0560648.1 CWF complex protein sap62 [Tilletia horrida]
MDYQNRAGNKGAGVAGASEANVDRRERLRRLALETIDLAKEPYLLRNHLGSLECRLCLTLHTNEGSYLAHTQGKKHQTNLARRAAKQAKDEARGFGGHGSIGYNQTLMITGANAIPEKPKKKFNKIGRPGYNVTKIREPLLPEDANVPSSNSRRPDGEGGDDKDAAEVADGDVDMDNGDAAAPSASGKPGGRQGLLFQVQLPLIADNVKPLHRFMSSFEQTVEPQSRTWQYLVVAAEPYETIAFKLPSRLVERKQGVVLPDNQSALAPGKLVDEPPTWSHWSPDSKTYTIQVIFR